MLGRTPLSSRAKHFTPQADMSQGSSSHQVSDAFQLPALTSAFMLMPVYIAGVAQAESPTMAVVPEVQRVARGRAFTKDDYNSHFARALRLPSRTPSPSQSGWSSCLSEVSVATGLSTAESLFTQESSLTGAEAVSEASESLLYPDFVVKNTFVHFNISNEEDEDGRGAPELTRSASAPSILLSCTFQAFSMMELHEMGECSPCAYTHGKADGCRQGAQCRFCHLCDRGELKQRKKKRAKALKEKRSAWKAERAERAEQAELADVDQSLPSI